LGAKILETLYRRLVANFFDPRFTDWIFYYSPTFFAHRFSIKNPSDRIQHQLTRPLFPKIEVLEADVKAVFPLLVVMVDGGLLRHFSPPA
jgi:hypothetical protein